MAAMPKIIEGTWEEIVGRSQELAGHRLKVATRAFSRDSAGAHGVLCSSHALPGRQGPCLSPDDAMARISKFKTDFAMFPEAPDIFPQWERLVSTYKPRSRVVFDLRLVAAMVVHGIPEILSFNDLDFTAFTEISAVNPFDLLGTSRV